MNKILKLLSILSIFSPLLQAEDALRSSTTGFYPIWENTGNIEGHRLARVGISDAEVGIGNFAQIGINPVLFAYRTPNAYLKFNLGRTEVSRWSLQLGFYYVLEQASRSSMSPMYVSRLDNPDFTLLLAPTSLNHSLNLSGWMQIHQSLTALPEISSGKLDNRIFAGYSAVAEFLPEERHGILLHFSEVGFWDHDFNLLGASYRYRNTWMEFRLGYFYRVHKTGAQSSPLFNLTFLL